MGLTSLSEARIRCIPCSDHCVIICYQFVTCVICHTLCLCPSAPVTNVSANRTNFYLDVTYYDFKYGQVSFVVFIFICWPSLFPF